VAIVGEECSCREVIIIIIIIIGLSVDIGKIIIIIIGLSVDIGKSSSSLSVYR
jgi:hypothetical protein